MSKLINTQNKQKLSAINEIVAQKLMQGISLILFVLVGVSVVLEYGSSKPPAEVLATEPEVMVISQLPNSETTTIDSIDKIERQSQNTLIEILNPKDMETEKNKLLFAQWAERINRLSVELNSPLKADYGWKFVEIGLKYNIHPYALVAIAVADTSLGKNLTTPYNLGNVGNTDTCPKCQAFKSWDEGIEAIAKTLTNPYLRNATKLCHLSPGGWNYCPEGRTINNGRVYATSQTNWNRNAIWAESWLHGTEWTTKHSYILSDWLN